MRSKTFARLIVLLMALPGMAADEPFKAERLLIRERKFEQAIANLEKLIDVGHCHGVVCAANLAIALSKTKQTERAVQQAQKALENVDEEPFLNAWEANEIGVILFRAPKRSASQLAAAIHAFRVAKTQYSGRASNVVFNLTKALEESGDTTGAQALQKELDRGVLVDPTFSILGDFQGVAVEHR